MLALISSVGSSPLSDLTGIAANTAASFLLIPFWFSM